MTAMMDVGSLTDGLRLEFEQACAELVDARLDQRLKDTPAARARVQDCVGRVDAVLDMVNEAAPAPE